ncbi:HAD family hydrolase [Paenibacillus sp. NPDC056579]|uniref:HAD family hydrolase n=1 Tax=unclassified Paenibacillus TaxID=185978 RepID=UPI001EF9AA37|nr:HAD-IA family hydrolase [Paenibacillus sp. H1-7]ULL15989.1 HAD family hydrolase [Paenibacillus sp. H1-7]
MTPFQIKGIVFDMDNTLLKSNIDFPAMKLETFNYLVASKLLPEDFPAHEHTSSSLMTHVQSSGLWNGQLQKEIWGIFTKHELLGMKDAELEPGARDLLQRLHTQLAMVILTNNSYVAALAALQYHSLDKYFDYIVAREQMEFMKPSPCGVYTILSRYKQIAPEEWLSVGDSWIDGKAAQDAGVKFVAYRGKLAEMSSRGVVPAGAIHHLSELTAFLG